MTLCMCLAIACTVSYILAQIGPNWTLLTVKITFRVIPHLSYLGEDWFHTKEDSLLLNNIDKYGKMGKPDLSDRENDILTDSMESIF